MNFRLKLHESKLIRNITLHVEYLYLSNGNSCISTHLRVKDVVCK